MFLLTPKSLLKDINVQFVNTCSYSNLEDIKNMIKCIPNINTIIDNTNALISSASFGRIEIVKFLLENGADPNIFNNKGYTALHCTVYVHSNGQKEDVFCEIAKLLIQYGAIANLANFDGDKPIDITKEVDMVKLLSDTI